MFSIALSASFRLTNVKNRRSNAAHQWYCIFLSPVIDFSYSKSKCTAKDWLKRHKLGSFLIEAYLSLVFCCGYYFIVYKVSMRLEIHLLTSAVAWQHQISYRSPVDSNKWPPSRACTLKYHLRVAAKHLFDSPCVVCDWKM